MFSGNICLFSFSSKLMFGAKSRKHLNWTLCFHTTHSSGSPWLLNALFVITDSSRGMDRPWCYCFVKETTLCAPTLTLWLTQSYILTHARAFNIKRAIMIGTKAPDIHVMMRLTGRCWQVLYFCSISKYPYAMGNYICK